MRGSRQVKFCIHLHEEVERVCNRRMFTRRGFGNYCDERNAGMERNKLLKNWSGRIKVAQLAQLMEEDIKERPCVEAALLLRFLFFFLFLSEGGVVALW